MRKIGRAHPVRVAAIPKLEVLRAVVVTDAVLVMHLLVSLERSAKHLFHDDAMLEDVASIDLDANVSLSVDATTAAPLRVTLASR
jgi:hypothetical protein